MKTFRNLIITLMFSFFLLSIQAQAQAIFSTAGMVTTGPGDTVAVPVTVQNFNGVASASLVLSYDPAVVTLVGTQNIHPSLTGYLLTGGIPPEYKFIWFSVFNINIGNDTLFEILFTGLQVGSSPLVWDTITLGYNEYSDELGNILPATFVDGKIDVLPNNTGLLAKVFLQGPFSGSTMNTTLNTAGHLPLNQPFNTAPWNYTGTESVTSFPSNVVDWVLVELRSAPDTIADRRAALLLSDGSIVDTDFVYDLQFNIPALGSYYVCVDHRNHMPVMTASKYVFPNYPPIDFSDAGTFPLYGGNNQYLQISSGVYGMAMGDINKDGILKASGPNNDRSFILQKIIAVSGTTSITTTISGYYREDLNLDGIVKYSGPQNDQGRIIQNLVTLTGATSITSIYVSPVPQGH